MVGGLESSTAIVVEQEVLLVELSLTVTIRTLVPRGKLEEKLMLVEIGMRGLVSAIMLVCAGTPLTVQIIVRASPSGSLTWIVATPGEPHSVHAASGHVTLGGVGGLAACVIITDQLSIPPTRVARPVKLRNELSVAYPNRIGAPDAEKSG